MLWVKDALVSGVCFKITYIMTNQSYFNFETQYFPDKNLSLYRFNLQFLELTMGLKGIVLLISTIAFSETESLQVHVYTQHTR